MVMCILLFKNEKNDDSRIFFSLGKLHYTRVQSKDGEKRRLDKSIYILRVWNIRIKGGKDYKHYAHSIFY